MMTCTQKNRAAKPYMHLPYQSLEELTAEQRAGLLCICRESISSGRGSALPSLSHLLHTQAGITWTNAHPQQPAHCETECSTCSKVTVGWGKLWPAGTQSNSVRDVLAWCNSPKWGISYKWAGRWGTGTPAAGWQVKHLQCKAGQVEHRRGQVEHWAPWMTSCGQQSCLICSRSLFCDGQDTLTHWHYRKLKITQPSFYLKSTSASPLHCPEADPVFSPLLFCLVRWGDFIIIITKLTILQNLILSGFLRVSFN